MDEQISKKALLAWKIILVPVFIFFCLHFLKDITQDILRMPTFLDKMGDLRENVSSLSEWLLWLYHWAWVNAFLLEAVIITLILKKWKQASFTKLDILIIGSLLYQFIMFLIALFLR